MEPSLAVNHPISPDECLYPFSELCASDGYPTFGQFRVVRTQDGRGCGVATLRAHARGALICRISGLVMSSRRLHTLQITPNSHLHDPYFSGLLLHSCAPNTFLDMAEFELWALKDILPGELLTMDYAANEDVLVRQFQCRCGAPNCRGWITGAKEQPSIKDMK